jgi:hypothetical protein
MVLGVATLSDVIAIAGGESPVGRRRCRRNSRVSGFRADLSRLISRDIETPQVGFEDLCMPTSKSGSTDPIGLAAEIVSAYVVHNSPLTSLSVSTMAASSSLCGAIWRRWE